MARPQPFKAIPRDMRNTTNCGVEDFKLKLDLYLSTITDEQQVWGLMPQNHMQPNSILHQVLRAGEKLQPIYFDKEKILTVSKTTKK